jgi:ATP-binding cassette subfamily B protein
MPRQKPKSITEGNKVNLKGSFKALVYIPRFFKEIWNTNKTLFLGSAICRLVAAVLPVIILWVGKIVIDEIILQTKNDVVDLSTLWLYVGIEFGLIILSDLISRAISLTDGLLGDAYSINSSVSIIKKTNKIDISLLEDSEFYDKLERARTQTTGRVGLMSNALGDFGCRFNIF